VGRYRHSNCPVDEDVRTDSGDSMVSLSPFALPWVTAMLRPGTVVTTTVAYRSHNCQPRQTQVVTVAPR